LSTIKNDRNFSIANKLNSKRFLATGQRKKWLETLSKVARSSYKVAKLATLLLPICDAVAYSEQAKRKTMTAIDVVYALKRQGRTLYGFGG